MFAFLTGSPVIALLTCPCTTQRSSGLLVLGGGVRAGPPPGANTICPQRACPLRRRDKTTGCGQARLDITSNQRAGFRGIRGGRSVCLPVVSDAIALFNEHHLIADSSAFARFIGKYADGQPAASVQIDNCELIRRFRRVLLRWGKNDCLRIYDAAA